MNLNFKNVGKFLDELSNRWEAKIKDNRKVRIAHCALSKVWRARVYNDNDDYIMGLDIFANSKKNMIKFLNEDLLDLNLIV